ncbi:hypothetical protein [Halorubrum sp. Ea8]|uniref:hypothetical protein n=1 Tax=Halorubrum sp. Ea8 TaxID=1383841 RepID=UPI0020CDC9DB|nr:hypothetical protein [Halorubrum sp. Ea8]
MYHEVVTEEIEAGYEDARRIERPVEGGRLDVVEVDLDDSAVATRLDRHSGLRDTDVAGARVCRRARRGRGDGRDSWALGGRGRERRDARDRVHLPLGGEAREVIR